MSDDEFMLFYGLDYYADGGWLDFKGVYGSINKAIESAVKDEKAEWWQVVSCKYKKVVASKSGSYCGFVEPNNEQD